MTTSPLDSAANGADSNSSSSMIVWAALAASLGLLIFLFYDGLELMVKWWERDEYSHGYMIPLVALFIIWQRINELPGAVNRGSWLGLLMVFGGLCALLLGELSAIYTIIQYGFLLAFYGVVLALLGFGGLRVVWVALVYLVFMIPLPNFLYNNLSNHLQLISSELGVAVIRAFDISVYLEGNVIDLGAMKLQVVDACSGLRYLFPLMSFGFLIAYLYRAPLWFRSLLFLSTIPITVLMNSFRIGVIGVTVEYWGEEMAEGFLHDFEGWIVFMACVFILFCEIWLYRLITRQSGSLWDDLNLDTPEINIGLRDFGFNARKQAPLLASVAALLIATPYWISLGERQEVYPERDEFITFPLFHKGWLGRELGLDKDVEEQLNLTDYMKANYKLQDDPIPVNLWIAYYESQRKGSSIHSPRSCIPGGGWVIKELTQKTIPNVTHANGGPLEVNRVLVTKDDYAQLVYYWFEGRGRNITNEYAAKWYIFADSMNRNRTDGALVRVVTGIPDMSQVGEADARLEKYLQDFYPILPDYIP